MACSTMSPMSRWSRNCTPLTTRPSITSRQGMILRAGTCDRLLQLHFAFPQRLADDGAGRARGHELGKVVDRGYAPRGLHRQMGKAPGRLGDERHVRPRHHAVATDVGDEEVTGFG